MLLLLFLFILIVIIFLGRKSYSKYITQVEGKGVIDVAKWAFLINGQTASITNLNLSKNYQASTLKENHMAPGTKGSFDIVIDTTGSDVGIKYDVTFLNEKSKPQNLKFKYDGHTVSSIKELEPFLTGIIEVESEEKVKTMTIEWIWPYETGDGDKQKKENDAKDTKDAQTLSQYEFDIRISGTQIEPAEY